MSSVIRTAAVSRLGDLLPNRIGDNRTYSTAFVNALVDFAVAVASEKMGLAHHTQTITLTDGTAEYTLDSEFISVERVEYSEDGSTYTDIVRATTFDGLDARSVTWRSDRGTRPELYTLLSAPGRPTASIILYPAKTTAGSSTVRVTGDGLVLSTSSANDDFIDMVVVPHVMATLYTMDSDKLALASEFMSEAVHGMENLGAKFRNSYPGGFIV